MNNKYVVDFSCSVTDFRLNGLSKFNITSLNISINPFKRSHFNIVNPFADIKSLYTARGSLAHLANLNGNDTAEAQIEDVKLSISWEFKTGPTLGIKKLKIEISIGKLVVDLGILMQERRLNDFLHALINEMGIELLNDMWLEAQSKGVTTYIENITNKVIGKYTLNELLKILNNISGDSGIFEGIPADCKAT